MASPSIPSAGEITATEFREHLEKYDSLLETISDSKGVKPGQKSLYELDQYRYGEALHEIGMQKANKRMGLDDVKALVEWKLRTSYHQGKTLLRPSRRHGKFRPNLFKLVCSNPAELVASTIEKAIKRYQAGSDLSDVVEAITKLRGIGPATASLLLAVHDPDRVIFFTDEAFHWLCCGGSEDSIKYNIKEYRTLSDRALTLAKRLRVRAVDVERVAFVLMRQGKQTLSRRAQSGQVMSKSPDADSSVRVAEAVTAKRKGDADGEAGEATNVRRSKRVKQV